MLLLEVDYVDVDVCRWVIVFFAELEWVSEYVYIYWFMLLGLWNVRVVGYDVE